MRDELGGGWWVGLASVLKAVTRLITAVTALYLALSVAPKDSNVCHPVTAAQTTR